MFVILLLSNFSVQSQCVNTFPYPQNFESNNGGWTTGGISSDWQWGTPAKVRISNAGNGSKCWISGGLANSTYNGGEKSWIESPCYDLTNVQHPYVSFLVYWDTERQYDGGNLQYSVNGGLSWNNIGSTTSASNCYFQNWYNESSVNNLAGLASPTEGWSGTTLLSNGNCNGGGGAGEWLQASACIPAIAGISSVLFRFTFCSGTQCNAYDGIAIDDFTISEAPPLDVSATAVCTGKNELSFTAASSSCPQTYHWDFGDLYADDDTSGLQNPTFVYPNGGSFQVTLTATNVCALPSVITLIAELPEITATTTPVTCKDGNDGSAIIQLLPASGIIIWNDSIITDGDTVTDLTAGLYEVSAGGPNVCATDTVIEIKYGNMAFPNPDLGPDQYLCPGDEISITPGDFESYLWSDSSDLSSVIIKDGGTFGVTVMNSAGCFGNDEIKITVSCQDEVWIPDAFSPNGDGVNDQFLPVAETFVSYELKIFNRWDQLVFDSINSDSGWNGEYNDVSLPDGIYVYRLKYTLPDHKTKIRSGKLVLMR